MLEKNYDAASIEPRIAGKWDKAAELLETVVACHQARQHTGIRCVAGRGDQSYTQTLDRVHGQHPESQGVGVSAPDENQVSLQFRLCLRTQSARDAQRVTASRSPLNRTSP